MNHINIKQEIEAQEPLSENQCELCGVEIGPFQADVSYDLSFNFYDGGKSLCGKHLDEYERQQEDFLSNL